METWMVFLQPETGLRAHALMALAEGYGLRTKETCFGALIEGESHLVRCFLDEIRMVYPSSLYVKRRGFSIDDTEICASTFVRPEDDSIPPWLPRYVSQVKKYGSS